MGSHDAGVTIHQLTAELVERVWALRLHALRDHPDAFGQPWAEAVAFTPEQVRESIDTFWTGGDNQVFVAALPDGTLVGMIGAARERHAAEKHLMRIWGVYVAPEVRSHGIAGRLLTAAINWCRSRDGVLQVHLEVAARNVAAVRAYRAAGFRWCGRTPRARIVAGAILDHDHMVQMLDDHDWNVEDHLKGTPS